MLEKLKSWMYVIILAFAVFIFGTSEFMPVGLLPDIAASLGKDEASTGLLLTAYAWVVALTSLPLVMLTSSMNRRYLILAILAIFILGNTFVALSKSFEYIMFSRIIIAFAHAIFWSIVPPLAYRLSPQGKSSYGIAIISGGAAASSILGIPLCTYIGHKLGWNMSFYAIAIVALFIIFILYKSLPSLPSINSKRMVSLYRIRKNKTLIMAYITITILVTAHFSVFTYFVPFLHKVPEFSPDAVVMLFLIYGLVGVLGILLAGRLMEKNMRQVLLCALITVFFVMALLNILGCNKFIMVFLTIVWSVSLSMLFPTFQSWIIRLAPKDADMASSIYSSMFNVGIGSGALFGGLLMRNVGVENLGYTGALIMVPAISFLYIYAQNLKNKKRIAF